MACTEHHVIWRGLFAAKTDKINFHRLFFILLRLYRKTERLKNWSAKRTRPITLTATREVVGTSLILIFLRSLKFTQNPENELRVNFN